MELDTSDARPAYQRVADDLRKAIAAGTYVPGDQLPTLAELTAKYGLATVTVRDAIKELIREGLVVSRQGKGAYVLRQPSTDESISVSELLDLFNEISRSVEDLTDRMTEVERRLADPQRSDAAQSPSADD